MSFPWMLLSLNPNFTFINIKITHHDSLQKSKFNFQDDTPTSSCISKKINTFMGKMSLFTAYEMKGSLTVETALVLPIFLFFILTIFVFFDVMLEQGDLQQSLIKTAKQAAVWAYEVPVEKELIELKTVHSVRPRIAFFSKKPIYGFIRINARAWTGADNTAGGNVEEADMVYKTVNGTVYHTNPDCSYLNPSIEAISKKRIVSHRNFGGESYNARELCGISTSGTVYITDYGNRYHKDISCSGLRRTILLVPKEAVEGDACCVKCAAREGVR